jgi:hypothetical protein
MVVFAREIVIQMRLSRVFGCFGDLIMNERKRTFQTVCRRRDCMVKHILIAD